MAAVATLVVATACAGPKSHVVLIQGMAFAPAALAVRAGDEVEWTNDDVVPHTVSATDGSFDSGALAAGATWRWRAEGEGSHDYSCRFHPTMKGELRVR